MNPHDKYFNARFYGAAGDGIADDRPAIQALIDRVYGLGGGTIFFPPGIYSLGIISDPVINARVGLRIYGNIHLMGLDRSLCTIKIASGQGTFRDLLSHIYPDRLNDVSIENLTFDHNAANNPVTSAEVVASSMRTIGFWSGRNISVKQCRFTNFNSMNNVMISGEIGDVVIADNLVDRVNPGANEYHDYSAIYLKCYETAWFRGGSGMWVYGNTFRSADPYSGYPLPQSRGLKAVMTAIETHGRNAFIYNNLVEDFQIGMIVTGERVDKTDMVSVTNNHVRRCRQGMQLWSHLYPSLGLTSGPAMRGCRISGNHFTIDLDAWAWRYAHGTGIYIPDHNDSPIYDLLIAENSVRFEPYTIEPVAIMSNAITALNSQADPDKNWVIINNILRGSPGSAIRIDPVVENLTMDNNS